MRHLIDRLEGTLIEPGQDGCLFDLFWPEPFALSESLRPPFAFPAGKIRMAKEMVALMPSHTTYVEPFAGSAAVFFAKEPVQTEVLNDLNTEVAQALRDLKSLSDADIERLVRCNWVSERERYLSLFNRKSGTPVGRLERFLYLARFSHNSTRKKSDYCRTGAGRDARTYIQRRLKPAVDRLKNVTILNMDYEDVIKRYDGPGTLFFIDPPYKFTNALSRVSTSANRTSERDFDEDRFLAALAGIKGKVLLNYGADGKVPDGLKDYKTRLVKRKRSHARSKRGDVPHLIGVNYDADLRSVGSK